MEKFKEVLEENTIALKNFNEKFVAPFTKDYHEDIVEESYYMSIATIDDAIGLITFISRKFNTQLNHIVMQTINRMCENYISERSEEALNEFKEILIDVLYLQIDYK